MGFGPLIDCVFNVTSPLAASMASTTPTVPRLVHSKRSWSSRFLISRAEMTIRLLATTVFSVSAPRTSTRSPVARPAKATVCAFVRSRSPG